MLFRNLALSTIMETCHPNKLFSRINSTPYLLSNFPLLVKFYITELMLSMLRILRCKAAYTLHIG